MPVQFQPINTHIGLSFLTTDIIFLRILIKSVFTSLAECILVVRITERERGQFKSHAPQCIGRSLHKKIEEGIAREQINRITSLTCGICDSALVYH